MGLPTCVGWDANAKNILDEGRRVTAIFSKAPSYVPINERTTRPSDTEHTMP